MVVVVVGWQWGPPSVQCNGRSSCEKRSPLFPTPSATQKPCFSLPGSSHISNIYTGPVDSHNAYAQLICFMYAHRQTHTCMHTVSRQALRQREGGGSAEREERTSIVLALLFHHGCCKLTSCMCPNTHKHTHADFTAAPAVSHGVSE